ncbi:MAG: iron chaperone [Bacillota bacterium]
MLNELRALIKAMVPGAAETISYAMPTFDLNGKHLVHFAAFRSHIGFYPTPSGIEAFEEELKSYKHAKGSVQFPLNQPLPLELIRRMVEFRVNETTGTKTK